LLIEFLIPESEDTTTTQAEAGGVPKDLLKLQDQEVKEVGKDEKGTEAA
jgi:hypothetical protein